MRKRILILIYAFCIILTLAGCNRQEAYRPSAYTKKEVQCLYYENLELFENLVEIISSNETFYEKGRINEYADADIISPYDNALSFFNDTDKKIINEFFDLKPYMILYDYARRFVNITFISSDTNDESYVFLFWTSNAENSEAEFNDYKTFLSQRYVLENIDSNCILYYGIAIQQITSGKVEYEYREGVYPLKMWQVSPPLKSEETFSDSITEEKAIEIACAEFEKIQQTGIGKDYVLRGLFYDTEDNVWIVWFSPEPLVPGACYNIAISKYNGEVLNMWPGE